MHGNQILLKIYIQILFFDVNIKNSYQKTFVYITSKDKKKISFWYVGLCFKFVF
jgi:hypothetical protein